MRIELFTNNETLHELIKGSPLHSQWMFFNLQLHSEAHPLMIVAYDGDEEIAHLLVEKHREMRLIPPGIYSWYTIHGEGVYSSSCTDKETVFSMMLDKLFTVFDFRHTFIEVRSLKDSRFAYNTFCDKDFFPRRDLRIYISLHSKNPWQRLTRTYRRHIRKAKERGITYAPVTSEAEIEESLELLRIYYISKIQRHLPSKKLLRAMLDNNTEEKKTAGLFAVYYKNKIIGCSICFYDEERAYLAYSCGMRKSHPLLYPGIVAVWAAIEYSYKRGYGHFEFLEPGSSRIGSNYLNFVLNFGGKQVSTLRWCHFKWNWINKLLKEIYV